MATPITTLELRSMEISRSPLIEFLERQVGSPFTHQHRHFLAGEPVHCGTVLQLFADGQWVFGRYEWSGNPDDQPALHIDDQVLGLTAACLLRWPK